MKHLPPMPPRIEVLEADITTLDVDAIVNAANSGLLPGGGVCGAIHRAAGPSLAEACRLAGYCPTGEARITPGFALRARYVIHAVGPVWTGGHHREDELLASAYRASLELATTHRLTSIAFPAISTGIYGFPAELAAHISAAAVSEYLAANEGIDRVIFCCFGSVSAALHTAALANVTKN